MMKHILLFTAVTVLMLGLGSSIEAKTSYELIAGLTYSGYDDYPDYDDYGMSAKFRYLRYENGDSDMPHGYFVNLDLPVILPNLMVGYGLRFDGDFFVEVGVGGYYGMVWGIGAGGFVGAGFYLTSNLYINVQMLLTRFIAITPYIGYEF